MKKIEDHNPAEIAGFLDDITHWAASRSDIIGVALVGSHARGAARPDSDVDMVILCNDPTALVDTSGWVSRFGDVLRVNVEYYGIVQSLRVFYRDDLEVEFGLSPPQWTRIPLDPGTRRVITNGMRILYDPGNHLRAAADAAAADRGGEMMTDRAAGSC